MLSLYGLLRMSVCFVLLLPLLVEAASITIDPGHSPRQPGAISCSGKPEYLFNEALSAAIVKHLKEDRISVRLSRASGAEASLAARAFSSSGTDLLLAIHHDSVQPQFIDNRKRGNCSNKAAGFSIFISTLNPYYQKSLMYAQRLGQALVIVSNTTVIDSELVNDKILSHSKGYIKSYSIVRESVSDDGIIVTINAVVDNGILKNDVDALSILRKSAIVGNPRIIVVRNTALNAYNYDLINDVYNGITESLTNMQIRVIDKSVTEQGSSGYSETDDINPALNKLASQGLKYQADYTLYFNVDSMQQEGTANKRVRLIIKSKLIDNSRAQLITSKKVEIVGNGRTFEQALEKSAREGGKAVVEPIVDVLKKHWMDMQNNGAIYGVVILGIHDSLLLTRVSEMLDKFPLSNGIKEVESSTGNVLFEVTYRGKRDQLDNDVIRAAKEIGLKLEKINSDGSITTWKQI